MNITFFNEIKKINNIVNDFPFDNFKVEDLINSHIKILFVLESPHNAEVEKKYPIAGGAGINMSKVLSLSNEVPLGKLIYDKTKNLNEIIGVMNICSIPMQYSPYDDDKRIECLIKFFKTIRTTKRTVKSRKDRSVSFIEDAIVKDFKSRWEKNGFDKRKDLIIVPCGEMANYFFVRHLYKIKVKYTNIPHPSFNNWNKTKYHQVISQISTIVK